MHLRVLRVSVVNKALEFFLSLASHNSSGNPKSAEVVGDHGAFLSLLESEQVEYTRRNAKKSLRGERTYEEARHNFLPAGFCSADERTASRDRVTAGRQRAHCVVTGFIGDRGSLCPCGEIRTTTLAPGTGARDGSSTSPATEAVARCATP